MDSGVTRALVLAAFAVAVTSAIFLSGGSPSVVLNGQRLEGLEVVKSAGQSLVPLKEAARLFGARVDPGKENGYVVEWGKTNSFYLASDEVVSSGGETLVDLNLLVEELGGQVKYRGGKAEVSITPAKLVAFSARPGEISLNFDRFVNFSRPESSSRELKLRFFNVVRVRGLEGPSISSNSSYLRRLSLEPGENDQLTLTLGLKEGVNTSIESDRGESGFHFSLQLGRAEGDKPTVPSEPNLISSHSFFYNRMRLRADGKGQTLHYLKVSGWKENYRLVPVLAGGGVGSGEKLSKLIQDNFGVAGLNANFFDPGTLTPIGLVIKDGKLLSRDWGNRAALGIDYFGRLRFFRPDLDLFLRTPGEDIPVQGLNRPYGTDDLVVYTSEYGNSLNLSGSELCLRLQDGQVRAKPPGTEARIRSGGTLVVATGDQKGNLRGFNRGDQVKFDWTMEPFVPLLRAAVSAGPLLIKDGRKVLNLEVENFTRDGALVRSRARRTVLANTGQGELYFIVVSDPGVSLEDLPELLDESGLDIENAIALDGGSSAGMIYRDGIRIESVGGNRQIPVGLALIPRSP